MAGYKEPYLYENEGARKENRRSCQIRVRNSLT